MMHSTACLLCMIHTICIHYILLIICIYIQLWTYLCGLVWDMSGFPMHIMICHMDSLWVHHKVTYDAFSAYYIQNLPSSKKKLLLSSFYTFQYTY